MALQLTEAPQGPYLWEGSRFKHTGWQRLYLRRARIAQKEQSSGHCSMRDTLEMQRGNGNESGKSSSKPFAPHGTRFGET